MIPYRGLGYEYDSPLCDQQCGVRNGLRRSGTLFWYSSTRKVSAAY